MNRIPTAVTQYVLLQVQVGQLSSLRDTQFKRLTGVQRTTFAARVGILAAADLSRKARGGRASKLCVEDRLLMALEYLREYPTYFRLSRNYEVSESNAFKICRWAEDTLTLCSAGSESPT